MVTIAFTSMFAKRHAYRLASTTTADIANWDHYVQSDTSADVYVPSIWPDSALMEKRVPMLTLAGQKTYHVLQCALKRRKKSLSVKESSSAKNKNGKRNGNENGETNVVGVVALGVVASAGVEGVRWILIARVFFGDIAWHGVRCGFGKGFTGFSVSFHLWFLR
ncbi:hypothetical protein PDIG_36800 [Penicillium digitatum PHI26]|uniref:Uncharacterized protein n=2 Tax=Penicillium digitatum TaxID=36651 RepID=K9FX41_PEND2|nr:hypothetical protein PDIP_83390 [Penicillium digitatum Pd1]EKV05357.1 hypothetical protein PDIP_83390 [Penicillium digitatum Pd1]EKV13684.1 hypothetical protein PDIG_36800 [Penicillium digitatum PHI26]